MGVRLHRVREHLRSGSTKVSEYARGSGSKVKAFTSEYSKKAGHSIRAGSEAASLRAKEAIVKKLEARAKEKEAERLVYEEAKMKEKSKIAAEKGRRDAREGGFLARTARAAARAAANEYRGSPRKRATRRKAKKGRTVTIHY